MITVLTGGTGGAKFVDGLRQVVPPEDLTIIVNTGDDMLWWGLYVSPDLDSITYMLAGKLSQERGWGVPLMEGKAGLVTGAASAGAALPASAFAAKTQRVEVPKSANCSVRFNRGGCVD